MARTMNTNSRFKEKLLTITNNLVTTYTGVGGMDHLDRKPLPDRDVILEILTDLLEILFPGYGRQNLYVRNVEYHIGHLIDRTHDKLGRQITRALRHDNTFDGTDAQVRELGWDRAAEFLERLPRVRKILELAVEAAYA